MATIFSDPEAFRSQSMSSSVRSFVSLGMDPQSPVKKGYFSAMARVVRQDSILAPMLQTFPIPFSLRLPIRLSLSSSNASSS